MAKFDIINAAGNAYKTSWAARQYLLRLAAVPVFIKILCFSIATYFASGGDTGSGNYILFMLIMVPALMAEGWMLAHYVRFLVLRQTWPFRATGDLDADRAMLATRARGILSGMIVFVLINMVIGFLNDLVLRVMGPYISMDVSSETASIPSFVPFFSILLLVFMFWGFRLMWLYIPFALNMDAKTYITRLRGAATSVHMIGVWLICFVPFIMVLKMFGPMLVAILPGAAGGTAAMILSIFLDTLKSIITTAGITFGLQEIFAGKPRVDKRV